MRAIVPDGWTVKAILHDGRDIADTPVEMKSGETLTGVQVVVSNRVTTDQRPAAGRQGAPLVDGTVIAFADDAARWSGRLAVGARRAPGSAGAIPDSGAAAGRLPARSRWTMSRTVPGTSREYLESIRRHGQRLTLSEAESRSLTLKPVTP